MSASVNSLKIKFASIMYQRMLASRYFIKVCYTKSFDSLREQDELDELRLRIKTRLIKA